MNKFKKALRSPVLTVVAFVAAAGLLAFSGIGSARAALQYYSNEYQASMQLDNIGVSLVENEKIVSFRDYVSAGRGSSGTWDHSAGLYATSFSGKDKFLVPEKTEGSGEDLVSIFDTSSPVILGKEYDDVMKVRNTGRQVSGEDESTVINEYVRVSIYKYWVDAAGNKLTDMDPSWIHMNLTNIDTDWIRDPNTPDTPERTVLYYNKLLTAGSTTSEFVDKIWIDPVMAQDVTTTPSADDPNELISEYKYDGSTFRIEVHVDAVQEHNAEDAILSAWGKDVTITGNNLSF